MAQIILKPAHFFSIDNDIIDVHGKTISAYGVAIYAVLARHANRKTGECWPAIGRIEQDLHLARSTAQKYLHKLEAAGLITITEQQDTPGDPATHLYTLLDPSPAAVEKHLAERRAARGATPPGEGAPTTPAPGSGSPPDGPPPVRQTDYPPSASRTTGSPFTGPEPSYPEPKKENQAECARAEETPKTPPKNPCPHPPEECSHFGETTICRHCWNQLDLHMDSYIHART